MFLYFLSPPVISFCNSSGAILTPCKVEPKSKHLIVNTSNQVTQMLNFCCTKAPVNWNYIYLLLPLDTCVYLFYKLFDHHTVYTIPVHNQFSLSIYIYYITVPPVYITVHSFYHHVTPVYTSILYYILFLYFNFYAILSLYVLDCNFYLCDFLFIHLV